VIGHSGLDQDLMDILEGGLSCETACFVAAQDVEAVRDNFLGEVVQLHRVRQPRLHRKGFTAFLQQPGIFAAFLNGLVDSA
jgi:hypothetical protein